MWGVALPIWLKAQRGCAGRVWQIGSAILFSSSLMLHFWSGVHSLALFVFVFAFSRWLTLMLFRLSGELCILGAIAPVGPLLHHGWVAGPLCTCFAVPSACLVLCGYLWQRCCHPFVWYIAVCTQVKKCSYIVPVRVCGVGTANMSRQVPRDLYDFLASVDAGTKERPQEYLCQAAGPLLV